MELLLESYERHFKISQKFCRISGTLRRGHAEGEERLPHPPQSTYMTGTECRRFRKAKVALGTCRGTFLSPTPVKLGEAQ